MPRYAVFDLESGTIQIVCHLCSVAYDGVSWHIFPTNGSKKSSKIKNFFNFTTRYFQGLLGFSLCFLTPLLRLRKTDGFVFCRTTRQIMPF